MRGKCHTITKLNNRLYIIDFSGINKKKALRNKNNANVVQLPAILLFLRDYFY